MSNYYNVEEEFSALAEKPIDVMGIIMKYLSYWKWFVISVLVCLAIAVVYIYFALPKYQVATSIVFKDDQRGGGFSEMNVFREMGVVTRRNNVDNEVEILKKSLIVENVVRELGLHVSYVQTGPIIPIEIESLQNTNLRLPRRKVAVLYGDQCPVLFSVSDETLNNLVEPIEFDLNVSPNGQPTISGTYDKQKFHEEISLDKNRVRLPFGDLMFSKGKSLPKDDMHLLITINHPQNVAKGYLENIEIELTAKESSVANISLVASNVNLGVEFLDAYIRSYNAQGIKDQQELAAETSRVIEAHLANLSNELSAVEDQTQSFRESRGLTDIASQANLYNSQLASIGQQRMDVESQYSIVSDILRFVEQTNDHQQIPASSGIRSPVLNEQIASYNNLVLERNRLARIASSSNQTMININNQLETTYNSVVSSLQSEKNSLDIQLRDINQEYSRNNARIRAIPQQERVFSELKRQQNIKEELFLYLLQKKEERYMNMTTVEPSSRIIDNILLMGVVWPNNFMILLAAIAIGMVLPIASIKIRDLLRYQIDTKEDLEKISSIPVLGEIPRITDSDVVAVKEGANDSFNEMLRLLRANLLFIIDGKESKVINVLSSISGEGKSFVILNLGKSLALLDKKILVIDLDIRKPKLAKVLGLEDKKGVTHYLSGHLEKDKLVNPTGIHPNLSIITAGAIPPNPNELLAKASLDDLVNEMKNEYDYILIDTPPIGLVSDGFLLNRLADVNLYITRAGYTPKKMIVNADHYYNLNRIKRMYFVHNYVDLNGAEYRYGFNKKYSYGYSYS